MNGARTVELAFHFSMSSEGNSINSLYLYIRNN